MTNAELGIPEYSVRKKRKPKPRYVKPDSIKKLEQDYKAWHYSQRNIPDKLHMDFKFVDNTANGLTKAIMTYLKINGHFAARINSGATYDPRLGIYRKGSGATTGMADINAVVNGKSISIEVKIGKDKMRESQKIVKEQIEKSGGIYIFVRSFDDFISQFNTFS